MKFFIETFLNLLLYFTFISVIAFLLVYKNKSLKKVQNKQPIIKDYIRELSISVFSLFIFSAIASLLYQTNLLSYTKLYYDISEYGYAYYILFIPFMLFFYDLYFYLVHRIIHNKWIFKYVHLTHHKSKYVSPLSSLSMHPIEAILNHGALIIMFFLFPIHTSHVYIWVTTTIFYTIYLHIGVEIFSDRFLNSKIGKYIYTSTTHSKHHQYFTGNYGFYTLIWDKLFKTMSKK